jgi:hypothetical protein
VREREKKENSASFLSASDNCCDCCIRIYQPYSFVLYLNRTDLRKDYLKMKSEDTSPIEIQRNTVRERRKEWRVRTEIRNILFIR